MNQEDEQRIKKMLEESLRENFTKGIMTGFESAMTMLEEYCQKDVTVDEVRSFIDKNLKKKNLRVLEKFVNKK